jgi:hypothetical protein
MHVFLQDKSHAKELMRGINAKWITHSRTDREAKKKEKNSSALFRQMLGIREHPSF